jgi:aldehyde dehydrogenase (NAD+)
VTPSIRMRSQASISLGRWRPGRAGITVQDRNPYDESLLTEIAEASREDLDEAYRSAADVQRDWARALPGERAAVLYRAVEVIDRRYSEIVDWLIAESGSTRLKAEMQWRAVRNGTLAAAGRPHPAHRHSRQGEPSLSSESWV